MKKLTLINMVAVAVGMALGPSALISAKAARPPIEWSAILIVFVASVIGTLFVMGIQILRRDPKYGRWAIAVFTPMTLYFLGGGIGALATGTLRGEFGPASVFIAVIGLGLMVGVFLSWLAFQAKFKSVL